MAGRARARSGAQAGSRLANYLNSVVLPDAHVISLSACKIRRFPRRQVSRRPAQRVVEKLWREAMAE